MMFVSEIKNIVEVFLPFDLNSLCDEEERRRLQNTPSVSKYEMF
jgi:hypothetical protein